MDTGDRQPSNEGSISDRLIESNSVWKRYSHVTPEGHRFLATYIVKPIQEEEDSGEDLEELIRRQASRRKLVKHNAILLIDKIDVRTANEVGYFEPMPTGDTLGHLIRRTGRLRLDFTTSLIWNVAEAVEKLHAAGLGHFALTPENIVVSREGQIAILDVGVAEIGREMMNDFCFPDACWEVFFPCPHLTAPELLGTGRFSRSADVFSIAGIAYYMLTGSWPFVGGDTMEIYDQIRRGDLPEIRQYFPELPISVERGIREGLSPNSENRPSNPTMLAERLFGNRGRIDDMSLVSQHYERQLSTSYFDRHKEKQMNQTSEELASSWSGEDDNDDRSARLHRAALMLENMRSGYKSDEISKKMSILIALVAILFTLLAIPFFFF